MHNLLRVTLSTSLIFIFAALTPINAQSKSIEDLTSKLEFILNERNQKSFEDLISTDGLLKISKSYTNFLNRFPNARWTVRPIKESNEKIFLIEVQATGKRNLKDKIFFLDSKQIVEIAMNEGKIISSKVISESSILKSLNNPLTVKIVSPERVLTGSLYDIDIIVENPLGEDFLSGGMMVTNRNALDINPSPSIGITPLAAGGLFKSIQAPFLPGNQTIAALIIHPEGIISITQVISVVSDLEKVKL